MIVIRKLKKKKQKQEIEIVHLKNNVKYHCLLREVGKRVDLYRCREEREGNIRPIQPSKVVDILRSSDKILLSKDEESLKLEEFLKGKHIKYELVELCPYCLIKGRYTILRGDRYLYNNRHICLNCAVEEIREEVDIGEEFIERLLRRLKDVNKVLDLLTSKNPVTNPELTRYDVLTGDQEDVKNYRIEELDIPGELKRILKKRGIEELLPVQTLTVKGGLLRGRDLLVTSATSSGKTLIGELAGVKNILEGKGKFLYLVPLVALANQKYLEFRERYKEIGLSVSLRVGTGRLYEGRCEDVNTELDSDIIVGTYEGIDYLIRSAKLRDIGTVVIDEVHSLNMEERGARLDGLIGRLRFLKRMGEDMQMIYLSATVGNPVELSKSLNAHLITYSGRPVPLERHILFARNEYQKLNMIREIVKREFSVRSKYGYRGQSLIFTYSRKRAEYISRFLNSKGIKAEYYHGGMEYRRRRVVEEKFINQEIMCVVTTAALAAGVDFPASTVILESLAMGGDWLTPSEFQQICGRAGRKGMHDRGKVYMLIEINKRYHPKMERSEEEVAFQLLNAEPEDVEVVYEEREEMEQILASLCAIERYKKHWGSMKNSRKRELLSKVPLMGSNYSLDYTLNKLMDYTMLEDRGDISITRYGYFTGISFLYPEDAEVIRRNLNRPTLDLLSLVNPFEGVYIPLGLKNRITKVINVNIPTKFIDAFEIIKENMDKITDSNLRDRVLPWIMEFEGMIEEDIGRYFSRYIINLRIGGKTPMQISRHIYNTLNLQIYPGDIYNYLENSVKILDAIERIGSIYNRKASKNAHYYREKISNPYKLKK
ncbi:MAG TPA: DEAD/DEAH box helicase [Methanothermococcus okinawensis]|uniref:DEAD/DEAH box helicase n=1 Tax=Methanothermococcus okinawensis TaxID=155863 RepID=A0A832ZGI1_9EURY|nr:DEAD/DEAH box helicase [Methanothermococcus okinawensis]